MSEIEKLYENAGIEPEYQDCCKLADKYWDNENLAGEYVCFDHYMKAVCPHNQECTDECKNAYDKTIYPEFTAEKQLSLIKWLMNNPKDFFSWTIQQQGKDIKYAFYVGYEYGGSRFLEFTEALADILNDLWQDLTEGEKETIRGILRT